MALFNPAFDFVLSNEVDPKNIHSVVEDIGGVAKYGINQKYYPNLDVPNLTLDEAKKIYHDTYWVKIQGDNIDSQQLATYLLDYAVNSGPSQAIKHLQKSLNDLGENLVVDGGIGPMTLNAIRTNPYQKSILQNIAGYRMAFYQSLVLKNSDKYGPYLKGWMRRARKLIPENSNKTLLLIGTASLIGFIYWKLNKDN